MEYDVVNHLCSIRTSLPTFNVKKINMLQKSDIAIVTLEDQGLMFYDVK